MVWKYKNDNITRPELTIIQYWLVIKTLVEQPLHLNSHSIKILAMTAFYGDRRLENQP